MIKKYKIMTNRLLNTLIEIDEKQQQRLDSLKKYDGLLLKEKKESNGRAYYSSYKSGSSNRKPNFKYVGSSNSEEVLRIKEVHHLKKLLAVLGKDISLLTYIMNRLEDINAAHINELLPAVYKASDFQQEMSLNRIAAEWKKSREAYKASFPPYRPEELNVPTYDRKMVRSKSEAIIYNFLLRLGVTFVYELPLETKIKTFYPDFTILSEIDYRSIYRIEHQGMMDNEEYCERFKKKVRDYLRAGYVQGVNIFYTFDLTDGGVDVQPIMDIIQLKIRPPAKANFDIIY